MSKKEHNHTVVYLVVDRVSDRVVDCALIRQQARNFAEIYGLDEDAPRRFKVVRALATPAPRKRGGV